MSSDRSGAVGEAATGAETARAAAAADSALAQDVADDAPADDPWFTPGPKTAASPGDADAYADVAADGAVEGSAVEASTGHASTGEASASADGRARQAEWFLRTGRAGLHPDSEPSWDDASADHEVRVTAAGAPPWAGETTDISASTPPPWETGPWPGPDGLRSPGSRDVDGNAETGARALDSAASGTLARGAAPASAAMEGAGMFAPPVRWPARTVVTAGLIPLVVPGLVLGILSLRQPGGRAVRRASWVAIGASAAWALIIIVIVATVSGGSAGGCGGYPTAVHQAYEKALKDLTSNAPASVQAADLETAASMANASAAAAGQIGVRTALFSMANDMAQARADVMAQRPIPSALRQHLADDGAVPSGSCAS